MKSQARHVIRGHEWPSVEDMRFNSRELACLAQSGDIDKEGPLLMKDKQDGLFKKGEGEKSFL